MSLQIAILGTRGIPANYGGFETFAEELSTRLVERGHRVRVYGRTHYVPAGLEEYRGVELTRLPAVRSKYLETVSHSFLSGLDSLVRPGDVVLICNAANAFMSWIPRLRGRAVVLNVDGIERLRSKWSRIGKAYYRLGERLATRLPTRIVTDARTIQQYYLDEYGCSSVFIPYGASLLRESSTEIHQSLGIEPGRYLLYVSRLEPENNAHLVIEAYRRSRLELPLVLVGDAPYARRYIQRLRELARDTRVLLPGAIYGQGYRELISHCTCFLQGADVGGTHPALLEAMGVGALAIVNENPENLEVAGGCALFCNFRECDNLSQLMRLAVKSPEQGEPLRQKARERVRQHYSWDSVTDQYEALFNELVV